jgi:hypothetical protein
MSTSLEQEGAEPRKPWWKRWWGIAAIAFVVLAIFGSFVGDDEDTPSEDAAQADAAEEPEPEAETEAAPEADAAVEPIAYQVTELDEIGGDRLNARVVVEGEPTQDEIAAAALAIMNDLRDSNPYSGLTIFLYDRVEFTQGAFTLGRLEDAPGGDWSAAFDAPPGQYDAHEQSVDAREKDWSQAPTDAEVELFAAWDDRYWELEEDPDVPFEDQEDQAFADVAESFGISEDEVRDAVDDVSSWSAS